jgi:glucose/mannose-6-phosphate isomerase
MSTSTLDDPKVSARIDPGGMIRLVTAMASQLAEAREAVKVAPPRLPVGKIREVVVTGLGGSAISGDILKSLVWKSSPIPILVNRFYELPGHVGPGTLVVCASYSGNTEETLAAFQQALKRKAQVMVMSSGGKLMQEASQRGLPACHMTGGLPPRAAFGTAFGTLLTALEAVKVLPDLSHEYREAVGVLDRLSTEWGPAHTSSRNDAKRLALFLHKRLPVIYAGADLLESVAFRWRCQINENAKEAALSAVVPEMNHNEILAYSAATTETRRLAVVSLRDESDHPQVKRRFDLLRELLTGRAAGVREARAHGGSTLSRVLSLVLMGDYVSVYLAYLKGVDPTPIPFIDLLKKRLAN